MHTTFSRPVADGILILDYGSQYTLLIARRLRELGIYCEVADGSSEAAPVGFAYHGIILSGGPDSVTESSARKLPRWVMTSNKPLLGICYGMQLLVEALGGKVRSGEAREYGRANLNLSADMSQAAASLFYDMPISQVVWMSHGDDVIDLPKDLAVVGRTEDGVIGAVVHNSKPIIGLQYHPEVQHTEFGHLLLKQFVTQVCHAKLNWHQDTLAATTIKHIQETVGDGRVLMAVSGGVDSTVAAAVVVKAIGADRLTAVFVDTGLLRKGEVDWVQTNLRQLGLKNFVLLRSSETFLTNLQGCIDPEEKRKVVGRTFIAEFEAYAKEHQNFTHLGQGTLYPDVIESAGHGAGSKVIKSHHNVGGLPEKLHLKLLEPFRFLFKDEVRKLGAELGVPKTLLERHPFPGPGLSVRILGEVTREQVKILQDADHIFIEALQARGLYNKVWQAFAALLPVKSVGVMGDNRTYQQTIALRAVTSSDGMTAGVGELPLNFLTHVADQIVRQVPGVNRVVYDVTTKPPATIEWE